MTSGPLQEIVAVLASPAAGNPSQYLFERAVEAAGLDLRIVTCDVAPERIGEALAGVAAMGFRGCLLAGPLRRAALHVVAAASPTARFAGGVGLVERTADACFMPLTVGGGVRTPEDMVAMLKAGADKVAINTAAVLDPDIIKACARKVGSQAVVMAMDVRREGDGWVVYTHGGRTSSGKDAVAFARQIVNLGAGEILLTSMDRDGTKDGYDIPLLRAIRDVVSVPLIASGGAGNVQHMADAVLQGGADAVLAASIFHFGEATIADAKAALAAAGAPVRPTVSA